MEARQLAAELAAVPLPEVSEGSDVEAAASALAASTAPAVAAVQAALQRTLDLTGMLLSLTPLEWFETEDVVLGCGPMLGFELQFHAVVAWQATWDILYINN